MASDTSLIFNLIARDRVSGALGSARRKLEDFGTNIGKAVAGVGAAAPAVAAVVTAAGGLAAGATAAGAAVGAFKLAAQPQLQAVTEAWTLYDAAQTAAAQGGKEAAEAQKAYKAALAELPPATRATAKEFIGLRNDFAGWSDSLSSTTMPVFTKGIQILRGLLPTLTPFVQAAAGAVSGFLAEVSEGVRSAGFKQWAADMSNAAGPVLRDFLAVVKNLAVGFGGLLQAFLPVSATMTGGLVTLSEKFAAFGQSLKGSEGMARFMELARNGGQSLMLLGSAALNLAVALAPLIGTTAMLANGLARIINHTPTSVLTALAAVIATVSVGMKVYAVTSAIVSTANTVMASSTMTAIAGWVRMNAVGIAAYARIAAASVASAATTAAAWAGSALASIGTWIAAVVRAGLVAARQFLMMAARAVVWAATMAAQWLIAMGPVGWVIAAIVALVVAIVMNWDRIKNAIAAAWQWVWSKTVAIVSAIVNWVRAKFMQWVAINLMVMNAIRNAIARAWNAIKSTVLSVVSGIVNWVRARWNTFMAINRATFNAIRNAISSAINAARGAVSRAVGAIGSTISGIRRRVMGALSGAGRWLFNAGRSIIMGLVNGIRNMAGAVGRAVSGVLQKARNLLPFSPAREGPFSGKGWTLYSGQSMMAGLAQGIGQREHLVHVAMRDVAQRASDALPGGQRAGAAAGPTAGPLTGRGGQVRVVFDVQGADQDLKKMIRKMVRVDGRGSVQVAFGNG